MAFGGRFPMNARLCALLFSLGCTKSADVARAPAADPHPATHKSEAVTGGRSDSDFPSAGPASERPMRTEDQRIVAHQLMLGLKDREALIEYERHRRTRQWVEEPEPHLAQTRLTEAQQRQIVADVDRGLAAHFRSQTGWRRPTDTERLCTAFERLEAAGILARIAYGMHGPDSLQLLQTEASHSARRGVRFRGYAYVDVQMLDEVVNGHLRIGWGLFDTDGLSPGSVALGEQIVEALKDQGLRVSSEATPGWIVLTDLTWAVPRNPDTGVPVVDLRAHERAALALD